MVFYQIVDSSPEFRTETEATSPLNHLIFSYSLGLAFLFGIVNKMRVSVYELAQKGGTGLGAED